MRPFRSFLLLLIFLICFTGLSFFLPGHLDLPTPKSLFPEELFEGTRGTDSFSKAPEIHSDSLQQQVAGAIPVTDSLTAAQKVILKNPVEKFLDSLRYSKKQVRILYYGDSQIEGDRLTSFLRAALRKSRGGTGPGLFLPVMPVTYTKSVFIRSSSNWIRYNYLSLKKGEISHDNFGPFMAFCRYMPDGQRTPEQVNAWIRIVPSKFADTSTLKFDRLRIFYKNTRGTVKIDIRGENMPVISDTLKTGIDVEEFTCSLNYSPDILIEFTGRSSPDIYGISIESPDGVIIDNIPQRGSAGLEFTIVNKNNLREAYRLLSPDLVILHYGLNIVKNIRDDYSYYERGLRRQLSLLNDVLPGTPLLVVGVTDMAYSEGDVIKPYPNLPGIIDAQRKAAEAEGAFFWDARDAMGGESSIVRWFSMAPPLAKKDYVHFTDPGADTLARIMLSDLFTRGIKDTITARPSHAAKDSVVAEKPVTSETDVTTGGKKGFPGLLLKSILSYNPDRPFIFSAPAFWIFFLLVLLGYSVVYKRLFYRNLYLFLVSLFFYYKTGGLFLFILLIVTVVDFVCGLLIYKAEKKSVRKLFVLVSIISNLGLLGYFKYTGFIISEINNIFGTNLKVVDFLSSMSNSILGTSFDISYIVLPVGISFFTFQSLSYTIDVYRRKMEPVTNIIDFGFYVSFFPHLVAGPIVRASVFIPQIYQEFRLTQREFSHSLFMISKGLIKKIIISNFIAVNLVDRVFDMPSAFSGFENLMAIYGYGLQIYCDFSGYTDIAIGIALILGFRLPVNFNSPYKALNISDFWKRWHISLSQWLRDYLYISLGGNRKGKLRTCINLMITMLLGGLWHGANIRFIIWGGLHGAGLVFDRILTFIFGPRTRKSRISKIISIFLTFQFVSFCWIFFRIPDINSVGLIFNQIFGNFLPDSFGNILNAYSSVFALILGGYLIHFLPEKTKESYRGIFINIPLAGQIAIVLLVGFLLYQMRTTEIMPFIYFRF